MRRAMSGTGMSRASAAARRRSLPADDADYFQMRAEQELDCARAATSAEAARAHYLLAGYYLDHVYNRVGAPPKPAAPVWR